MSDGIILTVPETNTKIALLSQKFAANAAIIDPNLMATMPAGLTVSTGLDALAHAMEAYTVARANMCFRMLFLT